MINADMRFYDYFTIGKKDAYGQPSIPDKNSTPEGQIKMAINTSTLTTQDNIKYRDYEYIGLTRAEVNDTYVIKYEEELLKVLYVNPKGRLKQVYLKAI